MALACVRQRRGPSRSNLGFCFIFKGFSLDYRRDPNKYHGRGKTTTDGESWSMVHGCQIWGKTTVDGKKISTVRGYQIGKNESLATVRCSFGTI